MCSPIIRIPNYIWCSLEYGQYDEDAGETALFHVDADARLLAVDRMYFWNAAPRASCPCATFTDVGLSSWAVSVRRLQARTER